ncbi:MAG: phosphate signaling complex protein PhoU [Oscillospiraceae bacterium]|nr:phosphate signaling complex protein PhoU [Oscillospiraceae bacterium]MCL2278190.1 phosphate signaling complex protein PhoU [Oscillospiraceae bacterium]
MRTRFDGQLLELNDMLIEMGVMIEKAIKNATRAIVDHEKKRAKKAIAMDSEIDQQEKDIEALCLKLLLRQQPVARDLRLISAAMKMITDMERIGDQAADISEIARFLIGKEQLIDLETIPLMAEATSRMVTDAIDAFVKKDLELAQKVIDYDDVVDDLFDKIRADVIELIQTDAASGEQAVDYIMIGKYFERIGDHATNLAEWVVFSITGKHVGDEISV